jgi:hypothetical protein
LSRVLWLVRRHASGMALGTGLVLMLSALAMQALAIRPLEARLETLERELRGGRQGPVAAAQRALERSDGPRAQLAAFYGHFERGERLTDLLAVLHGVGQHAGLELQRAEYRLSSLPERRLERYQVVLPVRGSYPTIRRFIADVLAELPTVSLDHVQFQRREVGETVVEAQVTLSFHLPR